MGFLPHDIIILRFAHFGARIHGTFLLSLIDSPLNGRAIVYLTIHLLMGICVAFRVLLLLLQIKLLGTFRYMSSYRHTLSFLLGQYLGVD